MKSYSKKPVRKRVKEKAETYRHPEAESPLRPDVGTQPQFKKRKPPQTYKYDSSLSPALDWDGQNPAREQGEAIIRQILNAKKLDEAKNAAQQLKALSKPFLNWAGKAERHSFDVPTLPLFVHERLSTKAIIETLELHKRDQHMEFELFGDPRHSVTDQVLKAYEYMDKWTNRMILGDSLVVMNSLLHYEGLGGQVQMIYIDPPYGVKFGSNFQPFVRKRDVSHNDDDDMTREPEMVKAYRDTWELGLHSYLTYMRDRLLLARDLLHPSGSVFVQISDENVHHVREIMDEVFGEQNFVSQISFVKTTGKGAEYLDTIGDYLLWYSKDREHLWYNQVYLPKQLGGEKVASYVWIESPDGSTRRKLTADELKRREVPAGWRLFSLQNMTSQSGGENSRFPFEFKKQIFQPRKNYWKTNPDGMKNLALNNRLMISGNNLNYVRYQDDFPAMPVNNIWTDTAIAGFSGEEKFYVVQTATKVVERCILMTTRPGDLVLDPTCGSGTTSFVAVPAPRRR